GDCVRLPDGRIARVRDRTGGKVKVRVRRKTSRTHQFLVVAAGELERIQCPKGWMSPEGYNRYVKTTLAKMRERERRSIA
ncbi:MAG: hypothetical protein C4293_14025, partial [Nitrospiraceae bacterium]